MGCIRASIVFLAVAISACATTPSPPPSPSPSPSSSPSSSSSPSPSSSDPAAGPSGLIQAPCNFTGEQIDDEAWTVHIVSCPSGCAATGGLWGTDIYAASSRICRAAIHAGYITNRGGTVKVILDIGKPTYRGTLRHGIQSADFGYGAKSFRLKPH